MSQDRASVTQSILRAVAGGRGKGLHDADLSPVLGVFAGPQVLQSSQHGLGHSGVAAQCRQPTPVAGEVFDIR